MVLQDRYGRELGSGSGFLVSTNGLIATNYHVIDKAYKSRVVMADQTTLSVLGVAALDEDADLALIKVAGQVSAQPLILAEEEQPVGTKVYAIGNPLGLSNTLSDGLLSGYRGIDRTREIQTSAPISPGSSGGPLLGADAKVLGVTSSLLRGGQNLNFAVPVSQVARLRLRCEPGGKLTRLPVVRESDPFARTNPGLAWARKQQKEMVFRELDGIIRLDPTNVQAYIDRAYMRFCTYEFDKAVRDFDTAIQIDPNNSEAYCGRGYIHDLKGDSDKAVSDFGVAIRLDPTVAGYYSGRGFAWRYKNLDKAIQDYDEAIRLDSSIASFYSGRGRAWSDKKEYDKAVEDYSEAIRLDPKDHLSFASRARLWEKKKIYAMAIRDYGEVIRLEPKQSSSYRSYAWLLATCPDDTVRDGKAAIRLASKACEFTDARDFSTLHGWTLEVLAAAYAEDGQFLEAVKCQNKALKEDPDYYNRERDSDDARKRLKLYEEKKPYRDGR